MSICVQVNSPSRNVQWGQQAIIDGRPRHLAKHPERGPLCVVPAPDARLKRSRRSARCSRASSAGCRWSTCYPVRFQLQTG